MGIQEAAEAATSLARSSTIGFLTNTMLQQLTKWTKASYFYFLQKKAKLMRGNLLWGKSSSNFPR